MIIRFYREPIPSGGWKGVVDEVLALVNTPDSDSQFAGLDFACALQKLVVERTIPASPLPRGVWVSQLGLGESMWARKTRNHALYLSRINVASIRGGPELRALLAANGVIPEPARLQEAVARHQKLSSTGGLAPSVP